MATPDQAHWAFLTCWEELHPAPLRRHEVLQLYWLSLKFAVLCLTPRIYIVGFFNLPRCLRLHTVLTLVRRGPLRS